MDKTKQKKPEEAPVVSPLANEKTYGERVYSRVFDWGLNYWTNLLASAGFSQWAEHATRPIKIPFLDKASPRDLQQQLAGTVRKYDPFFKHFEKKTLEEMAGKAANEIEKAIHDRSMARARSLTLLMPGFLVMIPSVWLGAKIKPKFVAWLNKRHYGEEAMDDPSLMARHQAIEAEARPTFLGTFIGRIGTVLAVQGAAQLFGSDKNLFQKMGAEKFKGIDPITEGFGSAVGGSMPVKLREGFNTKSRGWGFNWSLAQVRDANKMGIDVTKPYDNAMQDLGRFIAADTVYTAISAGTIRPIMKWLPRTPLIGPLFERIMSYKPKHAPNAPVFDDDGNRIKVPANRYVDAAPDNNTLETTAALDSARGEANTDMPSPKVSNVRDHATLSTMPEQQLA